MRFSVVVAAVCLSLSGLVGAGNVRADNADSAQSPAPDEFPKEGGKSLGGVVLAQVPPGSTSGTVRRAAAGNAATEVPAELQEVIVTSTRRELSLQDVPASVTAVSGADLEQRGISEFQEIASTIPSLSFTETGEGHSEARTISIRGVSSTSNVNLSEATGFYLDDTPIPFAVDPKFFDVQRIEVLRGPQGTLYGSRSMGGTVKIITNSADPANTSGHVDLDGNYVDEGGAGYLASGTANLPVGGNGALRISAFDEYVPGIQNKLVTTTDQYFTHVDNSDTAGLMVAGLWHVGDGWDLSPKFIYQDSTYDGLPYADIYPSDTLQIRDHDVSEAGWDHWALGSLTLGRNLALGRVLVTASYFNRFFLDREDISAFDQEIAPEVTPGAVFTGPGPAADYQTQKIWTGEARFVSSWEGPFQFVGGLYDQSREKVRDVNISAPGFGAATGTTDDIFIGGDTTIEKEFALYGEGTLHFAPKWDLTLGLRWSDSRVHLERNVTGLFGAPAFRQDTPATETLPKVALQYTPVDTLHFYTSASKGFRLGGVNFTVPSTAACTSPADLEAFNALHGGSTFNGDSLWNYELGAKMEFFERRIRINADAFVIDWTDIEQHVLVCGFNLVVNAGDARSKGGEVEITALITPTLSLGMNGSKVDARLTTAVPLFASVGDRILGVPDWQASGYAEWRAPISPVWSAFIRPEVAYTGSVVYEFMPTGVPADQGQGGTTEYNLRVGVEERSWVFTLYGTNLSNVRRNLGPNTSLGAEIPGRPRLGVNPTRTVGLRATWSF